VTPSASAAGTHQFRSVIIDSVRTPLGFFSLIALIAEGVLGTVAIFIDRPEKTYIVSAMIALVFLLAIIVAALAAFRPEALSGLRPPRVLPAADEAKRESADMVKEIAQESDVDAAEIDPKLVRFIPPLRPTQFKILNLARPDPPPFFHWPYAPTGKIPFYCIPFFLLPVTDPGGIPQGHLVVNVQPSQDNAPSTETIEAKVSSAQRVHILISAGHGWRMHEGVQFLHRRVGYIRLHFADGTEQRMDLILGRHLREWAFGNNTDLVTELDLSLAKPAWLSHNSTRRFDLLTLDIDGAPRFLESVEVTAEFEDNHTGKRISTPAIIVSAITVERGI